MKKPEKLQVRPVYFPVHSRKVDCTLSIVEDVFVLVDQNRTPISLTNDAERVVADLFEEVRLGRLPESNPFLVIYSDTTGSWDQIIVKNRQFE